ncbi:MAG: GNAT family N-acetyltransferase [Tsuneonella suprasediminis]|uniref:N-acetyltransferase n=1 Tax=Tsuneonella suprasediminis TaxID=2306996 RepID=A0A419QZ35_9SPHN|nr:GNAT family N-acetyltransferase [Tsuneonella suprasediminis]RJX65899.1 N-acetyltransferase [Tsuneonella suprasediminis]UBS32537.1 GNAT family N-acetyltransferase [Altererythrobacter sp. N1]
MFHRSERLFLRPAWPEDWEAVFEGIADQGIVQNLGRAPWPYAPEDARAFVSRRQDPDFPSFLVVIPDANGARPIGCVGIDNQNGEANLGYWLGRRWWGQGYATEAARAVCEIAHAIGHRRLVASHFVDNPASGRVLRKVGFRPTGIVRPHSSLGRGGAALAVELVREVECEEDGPPQMRAA